MRSILENDRQTIDGRAPDNRGPELREYPRSPPTFSFEKIVTNYKASKKIHGESFLQEVSGCTESEIERNKHIKEFQNQLRRKIKRQA